MSTTLAPKFRRIALLGGPGSGKSTYLGALLDALDAERLEGLRQEGLPADTGLLRRLTDPLLEGEYPQRTEGESHAPLELNLRTQVSAERTLPEARFSLQVADYSGEELNRLFSDRDGWGASWQDRAGAQTLLLFWSPPKTLAPPRAADLEEPTEAARWQALLHPTAPQTAVTRPLSLLPEPPRMLAADAVSPVVHAPEETVNIPTALNLIELLQFMRHARGLRPGQKPQRGSFRVALLISAWDSLPPEWQKLGPAQVLGAQLPLLEDFLRSSFHVEDCARFGLSSTGGDLNDAQYKEQYLDNPGGYVTWVDLDGALRRSEDLALPLYWGLFGEDAWARP